MRARATTLLCGITLAGSLSALATVYILLHGHPQRSLVLTALVAAVVAALIIITTRHIQITQDRQTTIWPRPPFASSGEKSRREYYLFVLGSGGHTKEMLMMMDDGTRDLVNTHRRYLISSGDRMSENHLEEYEAELRSLSTTPGTYDKCVVTRARRVHQPLWTTPWTGLMSLLDILPALLIPPKCAIGKERAYPGLILSNGPATGFFVALAVRILKVLYVVPADKMRFVYIESWARITTLSLTGKLLYFTGLADAFYVQHGEVAAKYQLIDAGEMVFNARRR